MMGEEEEDEGEEKERLGKIRLHFGEGWKNKKYHVQMNEREGI